MTHPLARLDLPDEDLRALVWAMILTLARRSGHSPDAEVLHWGLTPAYTAKQEGARRGH